MNYNYIKRLETIVKSMSILSYRPSLNPSIRYTTQYCNIMKHDLSIEDKILSISESIETMAGSWETRWMDFSYIRTMLYIHSYDEMSVYESIHSEIEERKRILQAAEEVCTIHEDVYVFGVTYDDCMCVGIDMDALFGENEERRVCDAVWMYLYVIVYMVLPEV